MCCLSKSCPVDGRVRCCHGNRILQWWCNWVTDGGEELPRHHQELVDLRVFQLVVGVPHLGLQLLLDAVVGFTWDKKQPASTRWTRYRFCLILTFLKRGTFLCEVSQTHPQPACQESLPGTWSPPGSRPGLPAGSSGPGQTPASRRNSPTENARFIYSFF